LRAQALAELRAQLTTAGAWALVAGLIQAQAGMQVSLKYLAAMSWIGSKIVTLN
jgi:hypothetical protein